MPVEGRPSVSRTGTRRHVTQLRESASGSDLSASSSAALGARADLAGVEEEEETGCDIVTISDDAFGSDLSLYSSAALNAREDLALAGLEDEAEWYREIAEFEAIGDDVFGSGLDLYSCAALNAREDLALADLEDEAERDREIAELEALCEEDTRLACDMNDAEAFCCTERGEQIGPFVRPLHEKGSFEYDVEEAFWLSMPFDIRRAVHNHLLKPIAQRDPKVMSDKFWEFALAETEVSGEPLPWLVEPSGSLDSDFDCNLHWPTFSTKGVIEFGETADILSSCPALVLKKGYRNEPFLMFDTYLRRAAVCEDRNLCPMDSWTAALKEVHLDFSSWVADNSAAKVRLMCGNAIKALFLAKVSESPHRYRRFSVSVGNCDVHFWVVLDESAKVVERIVVEAYHPEKVFHATPQIAKLMDAQYHLPAIILRRTGIRLNSIEEEAQCEQQSSLHFLIRAVAAENNGAPGLLWDELNNAARMWCANNAYSRDDVEIAAAQEGVSISKWLLDALRQKGEKILVATDNAAWTEGRQPHRLVSVAKARQHMSRHAHLYRSPDAAQGDPMTVEVKCGKCGWVKHDGAPTFLLKDGSYLVKKSSCLDCKVKAGKKNCSFFPTDKTLKWVRYENITPRPPRPPRVRPAKK